MPLFLKSKLLNFLLHLYTDVHDVPVIDEKNWQIILTKYGKDDVKKALASYIENWKPPFPYRNILTFLKTNTTGLWS